MRAKPDVVDVANEAIDRLECTREYLRWLSALGHAIKQDLGSDQGFITKDLLSLAHFLIDDHWNDVDVHIAEANAQMQKLKLRT